MKSGWQQPPVAEEVRRSCRHLGTVIAALSISAHPEGHEWICTCGQVFIVVSNAGKDKRLVKKERP